MRRLVPRLAVLLAAVLVLAACGGDDGGGATASDDSAAGTSAPNDGVTRTTGAPAPEDVAAAPSDGCGATPVVAAGETTETVRSGDQDRIYYQHVPPVHDGETPIPVIVDYHGYTEGGQIHKLHTALGPFGDEQGFVTITPESGYPVPRWDMGLGSVDLAMFGDVLDQVEADLCVDTNRVFVAGLSNGAFMTSSVACEYSDRVAAASPVAGITDPDGCEFDRPVPVISFHGIADGFVAFEGGLGEDAMNLPTPDGEGTIGDDLTPEEQAEAAQRPSIPEVAAAWAERNGCETTPDEEEVSGEVTEQAFPCPPGAETELYVIDGGGHTWPGSDFDDSITNIVGHVTHDISANELMWAFFQEHPLAG